jgi:hypothetical protein
MSASLAPAMANGIAFRCKTPSHGIESCSKACEA